MNSIKKYSLNVEGIKDAIMSYSFTDSTIKITISEPDKAKIVCHITKDDDTGVLNFYIKKSGLVSINIQGSEKIASLCEACRNYVIQRTAIPNTIQKTFTIHKSKADNLDYFKEELNSHGLSLILADSKSPIHERAEISDSHGTKVSYTLYNNGTFLLQGNVCSLFLVIMTEALNWLVDKDENVAQAISFDNTTHRFEEKIEKLVPNLGKSGDTDGVLERMILTSVSLFNSGVIVEDYGCYTFGVLKALEGILKLRLSEDLGIIDKLGEHFSYDQTSHKHHIGANVYDDNIELKKAINKAYNIWVSSRHATFHADEQISTSTLLSYEQAHEIFIESIEVINNICNNWD